MRSFYFQFRVFILNIFQKEIDFKDKNAFQLDAYRPLVDRMPESASQWGVCSRGVSALGGVCSGGCPLGGVSAPGWEWCVLRRGWGCLIRGLGGCLLPGGSAPGGSAPRGGCSWRVCSGGSCLEGVCSGGVCSGGCLLLGGGGGCLL